MRITGTKRLTNSVNGNPRFRVFFSDGTSALTKSDASCSYEVDNFARSQAEVVVTYTRGGRVETISRLHRLTTKWEHLDFRTRESLDNTRCGLKCAGCNVTLETEGDFARHFTISDTRYLNLGNCPLTKNVR